MPDESLKHFPAQRFVERLVHAGSNLGRQLDHAMAMPLRSYLRSLIPERPSKPPNRSLEFLVGALETYLLDRGEPDVVEACNALLSTRVIQQADHSNLLLDSETFLNDFLFQIAWREAGGSIAINSQCSTVACLSRRLPVGGPLFLWTRGACFKVFPYSKRQLKDSSFCALPAPMEFRFEVIDGAPPPVDADPILSPLLGRRVANAANGFRTANAEIWSALQVDHSIRRVAVDERMASHAIARHIEDRSSAIHNLLFDCELRDRFLQIKRELVASSHNIAVNHAEPDFLWYRKGAQLRAVVVEGVGAAARLAMASDGSPMPVPYEPSSIIEGLHRGDLYGDRILAYMVRCLLPGVVAIGGTVQQDYVDLYRYILLETHRERPFLSADEVDNVSRRDLTRLGGAPLLELDDSQKKLLAWLDPSSSLEEFERSFLDMPVGETIGKMDCAWFYEQLLERQSKSLRREESLR